MKPTFNLLILWAFLSWRIFPCHALTSLPTHFENASEEVRAEYRMLKAKDYRAAQLEREKVWQSRRLQVKQQLLRSLPCPETLPARESLTPAVETLSSNEPNPLVKTLNQSAALALAIFLGWLLWKNVLVPHVVEVYCGARKRQEPAPKKVPMKTSKPDSFFSRSGSARGNRKKSSTSRAKSIVQPVFKSSNEIVRVWVLD